MVRINIWVQYGLRLYSFVWTLHIVHMIIMVTCLKAAESLFRFHPPPWQKQRSLSRPSDKILRSGLTYFLSRPTFLRKCRFLQLHQIHCVIFVPINLAVCCRCMSIANQCGNHTKQYPVCNSLTYCLVCHLKRPMSCLWDQHSYPMKTATSKEDHVFLHIMRETGFSQRPGSEWGWSDELDAVSLSTRSKDV